MSDQFVGEIRMFSGNFAPIDWALCNGQILSISQYSALFSLLGTYYGGNGTSNFQLPNLQGSVPIDWGQGPGLSDYVIGETGGTPTVTLFQTEMPLHTHNLMAATSSGQVSPAGHAFGAMGRGKPPAYAPATSLVPMSINSVGFVVGNLPHNNMPPYLCVTFIIALIGIFPPRG